MIRLEGENGGESSAEKEGHRGDEVVAGLSERAVSEECEDGNDTGSPMQEIRSPLIRRPK